MKELSSSQIGIDPVDGLAIGLNELTINPGTMTDAIEFFSNEPVFDQPASHRVPSGMNRSAK